MKARRKRSAQTSPPAPTTRESSAALSRSEAVAVPVAMGGHRWHDDHNHRLLRLGSNEIVGHMLSAYQQHCLIFDDAKIGKGTRIGNFVMIRDHTIIGENCLIGSYVDIEGDVRIGNFVSIQSACYLTRGILIEDEVFLGPRIVTMNDKAICYRRPTQHFNRQAPRILRAARVGGGSVLLPGVTIGENAFIGAGSVVTRDVPDRSILTGNPGRIVGTVPPDQII